MMKVKDAMSRSVITTELTTPLKDVARLLIDNRISGMPVVDIDGTVLGVVSEVDFLIKEGGPVARRPRALEWVVGHSRAGRARTAKIEALTAHEAMTSPAITIGPERPIAEAASLMTERKISRLPVVDDSGRLVGIVSRADLVRAYVRSDDELARTIREDVILGILWLDPSSFRVDVRDGIAHIQGRVERRSTAEMLERTIAMVPGILDVDCRVRWSLDDKQIEPPTLDAMFPFGPH